jgi:hypothetical protein
MTQPTLAFGLRRKGRHYPWPPQDPTDWPRNQWGSVDPETLETEAVPSVTNVLGVVDKAALKYWAAEMAIREMHGNVYKDVEAAIRAHKNACDRVANRRAEAGTRAHTLAERLTNDTALPSSISEEDEKYADGYLEFWSDHDPEPVAVEATLYGDGYAGTADLVAKLTVNFSRLLVVADYKTKGERDEKKLARYGILYDEHRMQLAALAKAHSLAVPVDIGWRVDPAPEVDAVLGVCLFPDGSYETELIEGVELDRWYSAFLGALRLWKGLNDVS